MLAISKYMKNKVNPFQFSDTCTPTNLLPCGKWYLNTYIPKYIIYYILINNIFDTYQKYM